MTNEELIDEYVEWLIFAEMPQAVLGSSDFIHRDQLLYELSQRKEITDEMIKEEQFSKLKNFYYEVMELAIKQNDIEKENKNGK
jgi:hypothetical protein